jgi:hypothetical protein
MLPTIEKSTILVEIFILLGGKKKGLTIQLLIFQKLSD